MSEVLQPPPPYTKKPQKRLIVGIIVGIIGSLVAFLHFTNFGYVTNTQIIANVSSKTLINKENKSVKVKSVHITNNFITPKSVTLPYLRICMKDNERDKEGILLHTSYEGRKSTLFAKNEKIISAPGSTILLDPYTELQLSYWASGDWYEYVFQYADYDELSLQVMDQIPQKDACSKSNVVDPAGVIPIIKDDCRTCMTSPGGPDLSVIDFITNDTVISPNSHISFIPIIKNIGDKPSGKLRVAYYLDGKHTSSFELDNLQPGEIINSFIAGSGFKGNFEDRNERTMNLRVEVTALEAIDKNIDNNTYDWSFQYVTKLLPKHSCTFTDNNSGPNDFLYATSIQYNDKKFTDACIDDTYLLEYTCDQHPAYEGDDSIEVFLYKCPRGCSAGACRPY